MVKHPRESKGQDHRENHRPPVTAEAVDNQVVAHHDAENRHREPHTDDGEEECREARQRRVAMGRERVEEVTLHAVIRKAARDADQEVKNC